MSGLPGNKKFSFPEGLLHIVRSYLRVAVVETALYPTAHPTSSVTRLDFPIPLGVRFRCTNMIHNLAHQQTNVCCKHLRLTGGIASGFRN